MPSITTREEAVRAGAGHLHRARQHVYIGQDAHLPQHRQQLRLAGRAGLVFAVDELEQACAARRRRWAGNEEDDAPPRRGLQLFEERHDLAHEVGDVRRQRDVSRHGLGLQPAAAHQAHVLDARLGRQRFELVGHAGRRLDVDQLAAAQRQRQADSPRAAAHVEQHVVRLQVFGDHAEVGIQRAPRIGAEVARHRPPPDVAGRRAVAHTRALCGDRVDTGRVRVGSGHSE
jgi:hypothetical protein